MSRRAQFEARVATTRAALIDAGRPDLAERITPGRGGATTGVLAGDRDLDDYKLAYRATALGVNAHPGNQADTFCWRCGWLIDADACERIALTDMLTYRTCGRWPS